MKTFKPLKRSLKIGIIPVLVLGLLVGLSTYWIGMTYFKYYYEEEYEIKDFPLMVQPDGVTCGPVAAQMVLKYYGKDISLKEVRKVAKTDVYIKGDIEIGGTAPEYEKIALDYFGVPCKFKSMKLNELKWHVSENRPVLVVVRSGENMWHWIVATGYTAETVIFSDPADGKRWEYSNERFNNCWSFKADMEGNDCTISCYLCKGSGYIIQGIGPLGKCDLCGGLGTLPDWHEILVEWGELRGHMAIVPIN
jgi:hypothetical protein